MNSGLMRRRRFFPEVAIRKQCLKTRKKQFLNNFKYAVTLMGKKNESDVSHTINSNLNGVLKSVLLRDTIRICIASILKILMINVTIKY